MKSNKFSINKPVGGYSAQNLISDVFFGKKNKIKLSFKIFDIALINGSEILKLELHNKNICRIMKFNDEKTQIQSLIFDIVDNNKKEILYKSDRIFHNAAGIGGYLFSCNFITQWEIVPTDKICRAFVLGDRDTFLQLIKTYNLKLSLSAEQYIKNNLE